MYPPCIMIRDLALCPAVLDKTTMKFLIHMTSRDLFDTKAHSTRATELNEEAPHYPTTTYQVSVGLIYFLVTLCSLIFQYYLN